MQLLVVAGPWLYFFFFFFFLEAGGSPQLQQVIYISLPCGGPLQVLWLLQSQQGGERDSSNTGTAILYVVTGSCDHIDVISPILSPCCHILLARSKSQVLPTLRVREPYGCERQEKDYWEGGGLLKSVSATC